MVSATRATFAGRRTDGETVPYYWLPYLMQTARQGDQQERDETRQMRSHASDQSRLSAYSMSQVTFVGLIISPKAQR